MNITNTFGPYLVQRIEKPRELPPAGTPDLVEFHSTPATTATREANKPAIDALDAVVPMDYMGSAEFEFGEVSKCLREIVAARATLVPFRVKVTGHTAYLCHGVRKGGHEVSQVRHAAGMVLKGPRRGPCQVSTGRGSKGRNPVPSQTAHMPARRVLRPSQPQEGYRREQARNL